MKFSIIGHEKLTFRFRYRWLHGHVWPYIVLSWSMGYLNYISEANISYWIGAIIVVVIVSKLDLHLHVLSVSITTEVVSFNSQSVVKYPWLLFVFCKTTSKEHSFIPKRIVFVWLLQWNTDLFRNSKCQ